MSVRSRSARSELANADLENGLLLAHLSGRRLSNDHADSNRFSPEGAAAQSECDERGRFFVQRYGRHCRILPARLCAVARTWRSDRRDGGNGARSAGQSTAAFRAVPVAKAGLLSTFRRHDSDHTGLQHVDADGHVVPAALTGLAGFRSGHVILGCGFSHGTCMEYVG